MATVPMLAPNGQSGEIPQDKVQDALKAGFKQAVEMTSPDGKIGYIPVDRQQDALKAGFKLNTPPPAEEKSIWQKAKENFNANTQGAKPGDGAIKSFIEDVGAGGGDVVRALAHPLDTINAMTSNGDPEIGLAASLLSGDKQMRDRLIEQGKNAPSAARTIGQMGAGAIVGETAGRMVGPVADAAQKTVNKAVLLGKTPEAAYESALKPSTTLSQADRAAVVKTGLENEVPISKAGLEKLGDRIDTLNQAIKDEIASDPNRPINPGKVATRADAAKARFAKQVNAQGDLDAIEASKQQFLKENPGQIGASDAQEMKQGTYRVLKGKFGEQGSASVEAQKALARGLKEEIASQFPEIAKLNADESRLLELQPVLERAVNRISNHQVIGIGTPVAGAAAKAVTGSTGVSAVASVLKAVLDNPNVKSRLAIAISKSSKIPVSQALQKVTAYSSALGSTAGASQGYSSGDNPNPPTTPQP